MYRGGRTDTATLSLQSKLHKTPQLVLNSYVQQTPNLPQNRLSLHQTSFHSFVYFCAITDSQKLLFFLAIFGGIKIPSKHSKPFYCIISLSSHSFTHLFVNAPAARSTPRFASTPPHTQQNNHADQLTTPLLPQQQQRHHRQRPATVAMVMTDRTAPAIASKQANSTRICINKESDYYSNLC